MNTLLILAIIGQWSYGGFVANPAPAPPPATVKSSINCPNAGCNCPPYDCCCGTICRCAPKAEAKPTTAPAAPPPQLWRLADRTGQVWEFHDREKLILWVQARNFEVQASAQTQTFATAPACSTGSCPR